MEKLRDDVEGLKKASIEYNIRLSNGERAFADIREKLPQPMSAPKLLSFAFAIFIAAAGGLWTLASYLADRPTHAEAKESFGAHEKHGHSGLRKDVQSIQQEQAAQRVMIQDVEKGIDKQNDKLDVLIQQTGPKPPRRVRNRNR